VIVLYPLVLLGGLYLMAKARQHGVGRHGWSWFAAWAGTGALFMLSLITGASIGIFFLPVATFAMYWLALHVPFWREASGFVVGGALLTGVVLLI
jgi:hypothetical protein